MKTPEQRNNESTGAKLAGGILMAAGLLIAGSAGLCTVWFEAAFIKAALETKLFNGGVLGMLLVPLFFGVFPILLGVGLFAIGYRISRPGPRKPTKSQYRFK
jgi:hypothetical protein